MNEWIFESGLNSFTQIRFQGKRIDQSPKSQNIQGNKAPWVKSSRNHRLGFRLSKTSNVKLLVILILIIIWKINWLDLNFPSLIGYYLTPVKKHSNIRWKWYIKNWNLRDLKSIKKLQEQVAQMPMVPALLPLLHHILMVSQRGPMVSKQRREKQEQVCGVVYIIC